MRFARLQLSTVQDDNLISGGRAISVINVNSANMICYFKTFDDLPKYCVNASQMFRWRKGDEELGTVLRSTSSSETNETAVV